MPLIVEHCCTCIEDRGKDCVGIYRVPGNAAAVLALQAELDTKEPEEINWDEEVGRLVFSSILSLTDFIEKEL